MSALLSMDRVHAGYGERDVLEAVDLEVRDGEIVALVGANGAGKSTLLKCISGMLRPHAGTIAFGGARIERASTSARVVAGIAHVPEGRQIFGDLTVAENLRLGAYRAPLRANEVAQRIEDVCAIFPVLRERLASAAGGLSGGQQQMLAIGRGLMARPRLLLLDEPSLGLAPALVSELFRIVARLRGTGVSILLSEQNARTSLAIADRGYVLENGKIVLAGSGSELLHEGAVMARYLGVGADIVHHAGTAETAALAERLRALRAPAAS